MALKATIYKAQVNIADLDRAYYDDLNLTIAQHPSENSRRLMVRLVAFILNSREGLAFTKGLSEDSEPEIWLKNYSDEIELWIELGLPDEKRIKQATHKSKQVIIYTYGDNAQQMWWKSHANKCRLLNNLDIYHVNDEQVENLETLLARTMNLQATIQDNQLWLTDNVTTVLVEPESLKV